MELRCSTRSVNNTMRAKSFIRRAVRQYRPMSTLSLMSFRSISSECGSLFHNKKCSKLTLGANPAIPYLKHKIIKNLWPIGSAASDALIRSKDPAYIARLVFCPDPRSIFIETYRFHRFCTAWVPNQ